MSLVSWFAKHQVSSSVATLSALAISHFALPESRPSIQKFTFLSLRDPTTGRYSQGYDDLYYVALWVAIFTGLRAATMDYILKPLASRGGINKPRGLERFAEQAWLVIYYTISWSLGMYTMRHDSWSDLTNLWVDFPTKNIPGIVKWYYLVQFGFWIQQMIVVHIEERRKDHWQMCIHHAFTCSLLLFSYGFYQIKVGTMILCLMDGVDIVLSTAKILKYLRFKILCNVVFGIFVLTWFFARHVLYNFICWSVYSDVHVVMPYGCYDSETGQKLPTPDASAAESLSQSPNGNKILSNLLHAYKDPRNNAPVCFTSDIRTLFLALLVGLQVITIVWFVMIIKVLIGVLRGGNADDVRSDDEEEEDECVDDYTEEENCPDKDDGSNTDGERIDSKAPTHDGYSSDEHPDVAVQRSRGLDGFRR